MISFLRHSPKDRCATLTQIAVDLDCPRTFIRPLCPTHFTVRHRAIDGVKRELEVVVAALTEIEHESKEASIRVNASEWIFEASCRV